MFTTSMVGSAEKAQMRKNDQTTAEIKNDIGSLGRTPWIAGGDWSRTPAQAEALWAGVGTLLIKGCPTHLGGRELDWFLVAPVLGEVCCTGLMEGPCPDHTPVFLGVPR